MKNCLIITSYIENINNISLNFDDFDTIICADKGYNHGISLGLKPQYVIGDFDSSTLSYTEQINIQKQKKDHATSYKPIKIIKLPEEKDFTDTEAALDFAVKNGASYIIILGGLGGRFDHTMGNISLLSKYLTHPDLTIYIQDGQNKIYLLSPGSYRIEKNNFRYISFISFGEFVEKLTVTNVKYPLSNYFLKNNSTLCISNEILNDSCNLSFTSGKLLICQCND